MLSIIAERLLSWFNKYKYTPGSYYYHLNYYPKAVRRGVFSEAFGELLGEYGYE